MTVVPRPVVRNAATNGGVGAVVFDLDGVVYRGARLLEGAAALVGRLRAGGVPVGFLTNGTTLDPVGVRKRCRALGLDIGAAPVVTAVDALAQHLTQLYPAGATVLAIGSDPLHNAVFGDGRYRVPPAAAGHPIDAVAVGLDPTFDYRAGAAAAAAIRAGAAFIATNADRVRPTDDGVQPETGAICAFLTAATGVAPIVAGKPSALAFELMARALGVPARTLLMVGDNLDTDVRGAFGVGAQSVLVLTGVTTAEACQAADPAPTYTVTDLGALDRALATLGIGLDPAGHRDPPTWG